jgi:hypothetical protein
MFRPFGNNAPNTFKLIGFPIFRLWAYLMKVIPETRYLPFYYGYYHDLINLYVIYVSQMTRDVGYMS